MEHAAVTGERIPREVVGPFVDLLHERHFRIDEAASAEHAVDLADHAFRVQYVLQHCRRDHAVKDTMLEWDVVCITVQIDGCPLINVRVANDYVGVTLEEPTQPPPLVTRPDHENVRRIRGRNLGDEASKHALGSKVNRLPGEELAQTGTAL